jgi:transcriptional regulator with XRE-family HTH domain
MGAWVAEEIAGFGVLLRECRVAAGLSQEELMRRSGLDVRTIRNLERGRARWPYPDTVRRLADALDLHGKDRDEFMAAAGRRLAGGAGNGTALASGPESPPYAGELRPDPGLADEWTAIADDVNALSGEGYPEFLAGLHQRFHDRLLDGILTAAGNMRPGRQRIIAGTFAYLDGCRRESGVRSLLAGARAEPAVRAAIQERNDQISELIAPDFAEMGWSEPTSAARIWVSMAAEVALAESARAASLPDLRAALIEFLGP